MISRMVFAASLATLLAGCSFLPYGASEDEWATLTPEQKIELRRQWYLSTLHPPAAILTPAYTSPMSTAGAEALVRENHDLTTRNAELSQKLADTEKEIGRLRNRAKGAAKLLDPDEPPAPAAAPNPPVKKVLENTDKPET